MKRILFFLFSLLVSNLSLGQNVDVRDTIHVAAYQNFDVAPFVLGNILRIDYTIDLLDAGMQKVRDVQTSLKNLKKKILPKPLLAEEELHSSFLLRNPLNKPVLFISEFR